MSEPRVEIREQDSGAWFFLCTGERIFVSVTENGFGIRVASDRVTTYIEPSASNAMVVTTERAIKARETHWANVVAARKPKEPTNG